MRKTSRVFGLILAFSMLFSSSSTAFAATSSIMSWHLVDSGKHLDWGGSTYYQSLFESMVTVWNNYKAGVIRKDGITTIQDVTIRDYENSSAGEVGLTWPNGIMEFNLSHMVNLTDAKRKNVYVHELGHALGLEHNQIGDVMYASVSTTYSLSANDKASYDSSYARY